MDKSLLGIYLTGPERSALFRLAESEARLTREQAAVIIRERLIQLGYLKGETLPAASHLKGETLFRPYR